MTLLEIYEAIAGLLKRLPEGMHQPILRELEPLKTLFLEQRPPRLVLLGGRSASRAALVDAFFGRSVASSSDDHAQSGGWDRFSFGGCGTLEVLDARRPLPLALLNRPLATAPADLYLFIGEAAATTESLASDLEHAAAIVSFGDAQYEVRPKILGLVMAATAGEGERFELHGVLSTNPILSERTVGVALIQPREKLVEQIAVELPGDSQLEMARLSQNRELQRQIAGVLIKSVTAICGAIGAQPIPLADFPILTSIQGSMVASLAHISGREFSVRAAGEFVAALGANIGLGLALREGARAAAKLVPGWGNAISGGVAAAGTYAIGRAASAYFIDGVSLTDARAVFRRRPPAGLVKVSKT